MIKTRKQLIVIHCLAAAFFSFFIAKLMVGQGQLIIYGVPPAAILSYCFVYLFWRKIEQTKILPCIGRALLIGFLTIPLTSYLSLFVAFLLSGGQSLDGGMHSFRLEALQMSAAMLLMGCVMFFIWGPIAIVAGICMAIVNRKFLRQ